MFEMPKIVTNRLAEREARADAASHPEADLLTAFVEQTLPDPERNIVMKHLAVCAACREVVALAQPEEATTGGVLIRARPQGSRGLFLRWGALAACAVLAVTLAVLHKRQPSEALVAEKRVSPPMSSPAASEPNLEDTDKSASTVGGELRTERKFAVQPAVPPRLGADASIAAYSRARRPVVPFAHGPSPMNNNAAGYIANNTISNNKTDTNERNLPLNGRDVNQLVQLAPGSAGAARGDSKPAEAPDAEVAKQNGANPDAAKVTQDKFAQDEIAQKDEKDRAKEKNPATGSASGQVEVGAYAQTVVAGAVATAPVLRQGEIRGQVVDASNGVIADAKVTITNTVTGEKIVTATNSAGIYDVPSVPTGPYTVAVSKSGFQDYIRQGVNLESPAIAVDARLQVGTVSETVTVAAEASSVQTETSNKKASLDKTSELHASSARIGNMAVFGRALQAATWQITGAGDLQRSFDGGKSWESVSLGQPVKLRVVATAGFHVWAGGHTGALFHSSDGGSHFIQVIVRDRHATLTGDIVTLDFQDAQHGRIETVSHEVWTTKDGGKTWHRP